MIRGTDHSSPKAVEEITVSDSNSTDDHSEQELSSDSNATKLDSGFQKMRMPQNKWERGCMASSCPALTKAVKDSQPRHRFLPPPHLS